MASPSLLGLPRELRDMVYNNLTYEATFTPWAQRLVPWGRLEVGNWADQLHIHNLPLLSPLLSCSQVRDEYIQTECFTGLRATVEIGPNVDATTITSCHEEEYKYINRILPHLRHVTITRKCGPRSRYVFWWTPEWGCMRDLTSFLSTAVPQLVTIHVLIKLPKGVSTPRRELSDSGLIGMQSGQTQTSLLWDPPWSLSGLPLTKRGQGYQIGHDDRWNDTHFIGSSSTTQADNNQIASTQAHRQMIFHEVAEVGVYTYGVDQRSKKAQAPPHIPDVFPMTKYPESILALLGEQEKKDMASWPSRVLLWKEKSGEALKNW